MKTLGYFVLIASYIFINSCEKESIDMTSQRPLKFSVDTLTFDTVFQSLGSATRSFKIYNPTNSTIIISKSSLNRGLNSQFRYNIDGLSGSSAQNLKILPNDSLWVFAEVTVNPQTNSLLVQDSLILDINGSKQIILLRAFGQNAYFHYGEVLTSSTTWPNDKPHVILEKRVGTSLTPGVIIPQNITLTIQEGARLHFSNNAAILVQGTLKSNGVKGNRIQMRGLRLESGYIHAAGQWLGILIERNSKNNEINYTSIDESAFGIWAGYQSSTDFTKLKDNSTRAEVIIRNSTIKNSYYWALRSLNNTVTAENSEFYTSTDYMIQLMMGGQYSFRNCTMYNSQSKESKGNFVLSNQFFDDNTKVTHKHPLDLSLFENCIVYSNTDEALYLDFDSGTSADYQFKNCLYNSKKGTTNISFSNCILNQDPKFESTNIDLENLKLKSGSPCIDAGQTNSLNEDIQGNPRNAQWDIGAWEF